MKRPTNHTPCDHGGSALVLSLIFVALFAVLAIGMANLSGASVQIAENQRQVQRALSCAESGLEIIRYWMSKVSISGTTAPSQRFARLASVLQDTLEEEGATNLSPSYDGSTLSISNVSLDTATGQTFSVILTKIDNDTLQLDVTGSYGQMHRTIRSNYTFGTRAHTVFDFGVASKGPVALSGNIDLDGASIDVESNAYIQSDNSLLALSIIGNSHVAGHVKIANPLAYSYLQGAKAGIGDATGEDATHPPYTEVGVPPTEFPEMDPNVFRMYATNTIDANTDTSADATFENIRIPAGLNPTFSGHTVLKGIVFVETPNTVVFTGTTDVTGIIVGDGDPTDDSGTNQITFQGNVNSWPVSELPDEPQFADLHDQAGTFLIAPGFRASFGGSFSTLSGAIAANGIDFSGNAGGTIRGSIINYGDSEMTLSGNSDLCFNRSGLTDVPAGFAPELILCYDNSSYAEVLQ
jgi:Tfp pilus assembly protein PilX